MIQNKEIISEARASLRNKWKEAATITIIYLALNVVAGIISNFSTLLDIIITIAMSPLIIGFYKYFLDLKVGVMNDYEILFKWFKKGYVRVVTTYLIILLYVALWTLLLIIPGIIKCFAYSQTLLILASDDTITPTEAIHKSENMMRGYKMKYFLLNLRFIGWGILAILTLGIGFIWLLPYMTTAYAGFYLELKKNEVEEVPSCC